MQFRQERLVLNDIFVHYTRNTGCIFDEGEDEDFFGVVVFVDEDAEGEAVVNEVFGVGWVED